MGQTCGDDHLTGTGNRFDVTGRNDGRSDIVRRRHCLRPDRINGARRCVYRIAIVVGASGKRLVFGGCHPRFTQRCAESGEFVVASVADNLIATRPAPHIVGARARENGLISRAAKDSILPVATQDKDARKDSRPGGDVAGIDAPRLPLERVAIVGMEGVGPASQIE